jgi:uncharacterized protein
MESSAPSSVDDGVTHDLDPRSITVERISGWIGFGGMAALEFVFLVPALFSPLSWLAKGLLLAFVWPLTTAGLIWLAHQWPVVAHRHASYRVDDQGIEIAQGVVWRRVISVPRSRVQHTDVSQGPLERSFGLGTLVIFTAGTEHAKVQLRGLDHALALRIRDHLLQTGTVDAV